MLDSLDERYKQVTCFQSPSAFTEFLIRHYPTVASYWPTENLNESKNKNKKEDIDEPKTLKRRYIFKRLFLPFGVIELAQELNALDAELDYYAYHHPAASESMLTDSDNNSDGFNTRYWQQQSPLKTVNGWIFKRFIDLKDFGLIAIIVAAVLVLFSLFSQKPELSFYYDGIGVFATVSLYYLFWQLQLRLFATPNSFVLHEPWSKGWRNASMLLFIKKRRKTTSLLERVYQASPVVA